MPCSHMHCYILLLTICGCLHPVHINMQSDRGPCELLLPLLHELTVRLIKCIRAETHLSGETGSNLIQSMIAFTYIGLSFL